MNSPNVISPAESSGEMAAIQRQMFTLLLALIIVSGTLAVYLYNQGRIARKDIDALSRQDGPVIKIFQENQPMIVNFAKQLAVYAETHPDFRPILFKYGIMQPGPASVPGK
jgi:hypothetical protein